MWHRPRGHPTRPPPGSTFRTLARHGHAARLGKASDMAEIRPAELLAAFGNGRYETPPGDAR